MTAYFDDAIREVTSWAYLEGDGFLDAIADIESRVIREVNLVTGDREFPADLREQIQSTIARLRLRALVVPNDRARRQAAATKLSPLLGELHRLFHTVAARRVTTRFGVLSDSPRAILTARKDHDNPSGGTTPAR